MLGKDERVFIVAFVAVADCSSVQVLILLSTMLHF